MTSSIPCTEDHPVTENNHSPLTNNAADQTHHVTSPHTCNSFQASSPVLPGRITVKVEECEEEETFLEETLESGGFPEEPFAENVVRDDTTPRTMTTVLDENQISMATPDHENHISLATTDIPSDVVLQDSAPPQEELLQGPLPRDHEFPSEEPTLPPNVLFPGVPAAIPLHRSQKPPAVPLPPPRAKKRSRLTIEQVDKSKNCSFAKLLSQVHLNAGNGGYN